MLWKETVGSKDSKYGCVARVGFQKTSLYLKLKCSIEKKKEEEVITTTAVFLCPRGCRKRVVPANTVDTYGGGRKGDPQHTCCGKKPWVVKIQNIAV